MAARTGAPLFKLQVSPTQRFHGGGGRETFRAKIVTFLVLKTSFRPEMTLVRPFSDLLKAMETVFLGQKKVFLTLFRYKSDFYSVAAVKSYEGHQDPTQDWPMGLGWQCTILVLSVIEPMGFT